MKISKYIIIFLTLVLLATVVYGLQEVIVLSLEIYKDGNIKLLDFYIEEGAESFELSESVEDYKIEVLSKDKKLLYSKYFQPVFEVHLDVLPGQIPKEGVLSLNKTQIVLKIPYIDEIRFIRFYFKDKLILEKEIIFCNNNGLCETKIKENILSCPSDCKSGLLDNYCDGILDGKCDQDCVSQGRAERDIDCTCGNKICDERENEKTCKLDCKLSWWERILGFLKNLFK